MIPQKYEFRLFSFFMALFMSLIMSSFVTFLNIGFSVDFFSKWIRAWGFGFLVALPVVSVVAPLVRKIVHCLVQKK